MEEEFFYYVCDDLDRGMSMIDECDYIIKYIKYYEKHFLIDNPQYDKQKLHDYIVNEYLPKIRDARTEEMFNVKQNAIEEKMNRIESDF